MMPIIMGVAASAAAAQQLLPYTVEGDAIMLPLTGLRGDARRGESLVADRQTSLCLLCHPAPLPEPHAQGTLAPDLKGVGSRLSEGQIRLRIIDMPRLNPQTIMPSYYRIADHDRVGVAWHGKPVLSAEAIEDIVAFLFTLKE
jgi:sulfur-oxidizing protein SoxX